jgi:glutamate synthase (NADPH/NADH) large chain
VAADGKTGDGCGLLIKFPESFLRAVGEDCGFAPVEPSACGDQALATLPKIEQVFVNAPNGMPRGAFNRKLFLARRRAENRVTDDATYVASLSSVTISYKGMIMPAALPEFYPDLRDPRMESSVCVFHQRFEWRLAQPFRFLAHNGEINTIRGNRNWAVARAKNFLSDKLDDISDLDPIVSLTGSDSSSLDNMLEVLRAGGMDVIQAMRILLPPAWQTVDNIDPDVRAFYEFYDCQIEPWDGPAGIVLDRNGLRPARYVITKDRHLTVASEVGVYEYDEKDVVSKGRLGPGEMLAVDLVNGVLLDNDEIHDILKMRAPRVRPQNPSTPKRWPHTRRCSTSRVRRSAKSSPSWPRPKWKRLGPWAMTRRWPSCRKRFVLHSTISVSSSRKLQTRRSIPCVSAS